VVLHQIEQHQEADARLLGARRDKPLDPTQRNVSARMGRAAQPPQDGLGIGIPPCGNPASDLGEDQGGDNRRTGGEIRTPKQRRRRQQPAGH
jgi:hypothetical protein